MAHANPADPDRREVRVAFAKGASQASVKGKLKGREYVDHLVTAKGGQVMAVRMEASNRMAFFNVLLPRSQEALFVGSLNGLEAKQQLPVDGTYTIRVFLERAAARRAEATTYSLVVSVTGTPGPVAFGKKLEKDGISFAVSSPNVAKGNEVRVVPQGLEIVNDAVSLPVEGRAFDADVADLDGDNSPEVYVFVRDAQDRMTVAAWSANKRKSLSTIFLPPLAQFKGAAEGYRGGDFMMISGQRLVHTFPIHGADGKPTGKRRQLDYKLVPGEASWQLVLDRMGEF
ncbi:MAG: hypothetical protein IPL06_12595 [Betaproteobacteria bacterium]|nr:hypothetical protein [Betaproteobacteria bacterium]